jgi:shikimate dehydrogenase
MVISVDMISPNTKIIALIGNPVKHSLSPKIQNYLIRKYEKDSIYITFEFPQKNLKAAFNGAKKLGFFGLNITMPYKEEVFRLVDETDKASDIIKSVNTVKFDKKEGISIGFNTDVEGFIKSLDDKNFSWSGSRCLVIGAGGSAKSSIYGILKKKVQDIYVYNRTKEKVKRIVKNFKDIGGKKIRILSDISDIDDVIDRVNLIVNCTPLGMDIESYKDSMPIPEKWNLKKKYIFDMVYNPRETKLIKKAKKEGSVIVTGMDMLINQAVFSFRVWFGIMPDINVIKEIFNLV